MSLHIAAWRNLAQAGGRSAQIPSGNPEFGEALAVGASSAASAAITVVGDDLPALWFVRLYADEDCCVAVGAEPTATATNGLKISAGSDIWIGVFWGQKVAAIAAA